MASTYRILRYTSADKMCDLISDNYHILLVLNRFSISLGFKDFTLGQVCDNYNLDSNTLLAVVNLLISGDKQGAIEDARHIELVALISYLKRSHAYFVEYKLPSIREKLQKAIVGDDAVSLAVLSYYDEYITEVERHMEHEEGVVFKYVERLLDGVSSKDFSIDLFSEHHEGMEAKLSELKSIIIKYFPAETTNDLSSVLLEIFDCEADLSSHSEIEDHLLIPAIRRAEQELK
ncbi:MAG: hemerythrin domain-containing protein [Rikenellaceae bacterium]